MENWTHPVGFATELYPLENWLRFWKPEPWPFDLKKRVGPCFNCEKWPWLDDKFRISNKPNQKASTQQNWFFLSSLKQLNQSQVGSEKQSQNPFFHHPRFAVFLAQRLSTCTAALTLDVGSRTERRTASTTSCSCEEVAWHRGKPSLKTRWHRNPAATSANKTSWLGT